MVQRGVREDELFTMGRGGRDMSDFYLTVHGAVVTRYERKWLHDTAVDIATQFLQPVIVNIGVLHGATMHCLRAGAPEANLFGVDVTYKYGVQRPEVLRATMIEGDSTICHIDFNLWIHFLFIDGDHHYPGVKADIAGWANKVVQGGIIGFHDYSPEEVYIRNLPLLAGVKKAVDEWMASESAYWERLQTPDSICAFRRLGWHAG